MLWEIKTNIIDDLQRYITQRINKDVRFAVFHESFTA